MHTPSPESNQNDLLALQQVMAYASSRGWQTISQGAAGIQFKKPKRWSALLLWLGFPLLILFGVGLIFLLIAVFDYLIKKERVVFVSAAEISSGRYRSML